MAIMTDYGMNMLQRIRSWFRPVQFDNIVIKSTQNIHISDRPTTSDHPSMRKGYDRATATPWENGIYIVGKKDIDGLIHLSPSEIGEEFIHNLHTKHPDIIADVHK